MNQSIRYNDLNDFLYKHSTKHIATTEQAAGITRKPADAVSTHTRMGNQELDIRGGAYIISPDEMPQFYELYYRYVFQPSAMRKEYLTERQIEQGPLVVDFDLKYPPSVTTRQYTEDTLTEIITCILDVLKECYVFTENSPSFPIYVLEKPEVNCTDTAVTKDGIHMIIGVKMDFAMRKVMRKKLLEMFETDLDLPGQINSWENVLDKAIMEGATGWTVYGSRKPGNPPYLLTRYYVNEFDAADGEFAMTEYAAESFPVETEIHTLSARYTGYPHFSMQPDIVSEHAANIGGGKKHAGKRHASKVKCNLLCDGVGGAGSSRADPDTESVAESLLTGSGSGAGAEEIDIRDIVDDESLQTVITTFLNSLSETEHELRELHMYTVALPEEFYEPGSHVKNRKVAFALKHTDDRLFISWIALRSKASDFDFETIPNLFEEWQSIKAHNGQKKSVQKRSIKYWLMTTNREEFDRINELTAGYYVDIAAESQSDYDFAKILEKFYGHIFKCVDTRNGGQWLSFEKHRWTQNDGVELRKKISNEIFDLFRAKKEQLEEAMRGINPEDEDDKHKRYKKRLMKLMEICKRLKTSPAKGCIMREAMEIFYDPDCVDLLDANTHLLCCENGVVDFKQGVFRDGTPDDYVTKSTKQKYIRNVTESAAHAPLVEMINKIMLQLFPIDDVREYMWEHLSASLIGSGVNQSFHIYHGDGSNGKSLICNNLMRLALGELYSTVTPQLLTGDRVKLGATCEDVIRLKGVRYVTSQELKKGSKLSEDVMKGLTGTEPITARGNYKPIEEFIPQFTLVIGTNSLFEIDDNGDGVWRRIFKVDFIAKIAKDEVEYAQMKLSDRPHLYIKDPKIDEKLHEIAPVFLSMLVDRAIKNGGVVKLCDAVRAASAKYRASQDFLTAYTNERIIHTGLRSDGIGKQNLYRDFKTWYECEMGNTYSIPKPAELYTKISAKYGEINITNKNKKWLGIKFADVQEDEDDMAAVSVSTA